MTSVANTHASRPSWTTQSTVMHRHYSHRDLFLWSRPEALSCCTSVGAHEPSRPKLRPSKVPFDRAEEIQQQSVPKPCKIKLGFTDEHHQQEMIQLLLQPNKANMPLIVAIDQCRR